MKSDTKTPQTRYGGNDCIDGAEGCLPLISFNYDMVTSRVEIFWSGAKGFLPGFNPVNTGVYRLKLRVSSNEAIPLNDEQYIMSPYGSLVYYADTDEFAVNARCLVRLGAKMMNHST